MIKYSFCLLLALSMGINIHAQKTVRMDAVKANDFGIAYTLPKTIINITADYTKTTRKAGEYYMYAERYLSISNPVTEDMVEYKLEKLDATTMGVPDKKNSFLVEFKPNSAMAYVTLTQDGMICAINGEYTFTKSDELPPAKQIAKAPVNARQYFSEEILRAGSTAKQAELIAKQIYRLRESRNDILTGDADNMPPDGNAYRLVMEQLDEQEQVLTALFVGKETVETLQKTISIEPTDTDIEEIVVARFSQKLGMVEANNLAGEPIYMSLKARTKKEAVALTPKEEIEMGKKFAKGIVYNLPGKASLQLEFRNKQEVNKECDIVQYGSQEVLDQKQFGDKNSPLMVIFHPELGAVKQTGIAR